jgi:uncharacterized protein (TIGR03437 family)
VVSAADYTAYSLAPDSIVSLFAANIAKGVFVGEDQSSTALPLSLGGVSATITDVSGNTLPIGLISVTPSQVNAVLPRGLQSGVAVLRLTTSTGDQISCKVTIAAVAPSLFTADQSGGWLAAAQVVTVHADGSQTFMNSVARCTSSLVWNGSTWSGCVPIPIDLGSSTDQVVLELFGTGIRGVYSVIAANCPNCGYMPVEVQVCTERYCAEGSGTSLTAGYAGPQGAGGPGSFYGLDQINVALPHGLAGSGVVLLSVAVATYTDGYWMVAPINTVNVDIQ